MRAMIGFSKSSNPKTIRFPSTAYITPAASLRGCGKPVHIAASTNQSSSTSHDDHVGLIIELQCHRK